MFLLCCGSSIGSFFVAAAIMSSSTEMVVLDLEPLAPQGPVAAPSQMTLRQYDAAMRTEEAMRCLARRAREDAVSEEAMRCRPRGSLPVAKKCRCWALLNF